MDFELSDRCKLLRERLLAFMDEHVYPAEPVYHEQLVASGDPHSHPPIMEELKARARELGPVEPVPPVRARRAVGARASRTSSTRRWRRSWVAATSPRRRATAPHPTPATWRC